MSAEDRDAHPLLNPRVIIESLILAGVLWVGTSVNTLNVKMAEVQVQIGDVTELRKQVAELKLENVRLSAQVSANTARLARYEGTR